MLKPILNVCWFDIHLGQLSKVCEVLKHFYFLVNSELFLTQLSSQQNIIIGWGKTNNNPADVGNRIDSGVFSSILVFNYTNIFHDRYP